MEMVAESMEMAPGALPRPGRVSEQRLLSLEIGFRMAAELWNFSGEIVYPPVSFRSGGVFIGEEATRGGARGVLTTPRHGSLQAAPSASEEAVGLPRTCPSGPRSLLAK